MNSSSSVAYYELLRSININRCIAEHILRSSKTLAVSQRYLGQFLSCNGRGAPSMVSQKYFGRNVFSPIVARLMHPLYL